MTRTSLVLALCVLLAACAGVLGIKPRPTTHPFEHRAHVDKGVRCTTCHAGITTAGEDGPLHLPTTADCVTCHKQPHDSRACDGCHGETWVRGGAERAKETLRFDHGRHAAASKGDCMRCHVGAGDEKPEALRPTMPTCFGCHEHQDQWRARDCNGCHVDLAAEGVPPESHLVHEGDFVREHGVRAASSRDLCMSCHSERSCTACHGVGTVPGLPARLAFDDVKMTGLHRAGFRARHAEEARAQTGLCTTCHSESTCAACHAASNVGGGAVGARSPHPPGWLSISGGDHGMQARLDPMSCASCHGGAGEALCIGCHKVGGPGGNPHGPGFSSTKDPKNDVPCRACHGAP